MLAEDREELAREFEEFGFRETDDPDEAVDNGKNPGQVDLT
jgi:hypothetical protein